MTAPTAPAPEVPTPVGSPPNPGGTYARTGPDTPTTPDPRPRPVPVPALV